MVTTTQQSLKTMGSLQRKISEILYFFFTYLFRILFHGFPPIYEAKQQHHELTSHSVRLLLINSNPLSRICSRIKKNHLNLHLLKAAFKCLIKSYKIIRKFKISSKDDQKHYNQAQMDKVQRIFITGANRGLGFELVKLISKLNPAAELHVSSRIEANILSKKWEEEQGIKGVNCYKIDLNDPSAISQHVELMKQKGLTFDFIVANAAVGCDFGQTIPSVEVATSTLKTNVTATIDFIKQFLPLLSSKGRVVLVSAALAALSQQPKNVQILLSNPQITEQQILNFVDRYISAAVKKDMTGFNWSAYRTSKALLNCWGRFLLPKYLKANQTAISLHPGWCQTDMGGNYAHLTAEQGAGLIYEGITMKEASTKQFFNGKYCDYFTCQ